MLAIYLVLVVNYLLLGVSSTYASLSSASCRIFTISCRANYARTSRRYHSWVPLFLLFDRLDPIELFLLLLLRLSMAKLLIQFGAWIAVHRPSHSLILFHNSHLVYLLLCGILIE